MATTKKASSKKAAGKKAAKSSTKKAAGKKASTKKAAGKKAAAPAAPTTEAGGCVIALNKGATSTAIPLTDISVKKGFNPRANLGDLSELERSLKTEGILSALVVRPVDPKDNVKTPYVLVAGERRFTALTNIKWKQAVPVVVREDLVGDDDRARAVATAENSEDGRTNLNHIELGRVAKDLADKGWSVAKISNEMGLHQQKVRRCLKLMTEVGDDIRAMVEKGQVGPTAALEVSKMPAETRKAIASELHAGMSAPEVKKLRKEVEKEAGVEPKKTKSGQTAKRQPTAWKGSTAKQALIQQFCFYLDGASEEEQQETDYFELRAAVSVLLWDRGDLDDALLPDPNVENAAEAKKAAKVLDAFNKIVEHEAEVYRASHPEDAED